VALPVLVPIFLLLAAGISCVSPGPVLFLSERVGYRGRRFICFKFRTMKVNADCDAHRRHLADLMRSDAPMVKMDASGDPRLIPFGKILRATGLDELPQLLNVLGGEMSLVGPRPCLPYEFESYLPEQKRRFDSLPGLTGLWQVSGKNKTTFSEMIMLDIKYAETKSLWLDLKIMGRTLPAILTQVREARARRNRAVESQPKVAPPKRVTTLERAQPEFVSSK
jgi:lipopolysaccharide/colanic/teichoic acid biosynthesis glycosyltransferase